MKIKALLLFILTALAYSHDPLTWMSQYSDTKLLSLTLPGSHDSGSYSVTGDFYDQDNKYNTLVKIAEDIGLPVASVLKAWAQSQTLNIYDQLKTGARYVDLRIFFDVESTKQWHTHHGVAVGTEIQNILDQIKQFLDEQKSEIIVLEVGHDYNPSQDSWDILINMFKQTFGSLMYPRTAKSLDQVTLGEMANQNQRLVVVFEDVKQVDKNEFFWYSSTIQNDYADSPDLTTMENHNVQIVKKYQQRPEKIFYKMSWTLTPDIATVLEMILPWKPSSLLELADIANKDLNRWFGTLKGQFNYPIMGNIVIIDHIDKSPILDVVLDINKQLLKKNLRNA